MTRWLVGAVAVAVTAGCGVERGDEPGESLGQELSCPPVSGTNVSRSLAVTDPVVLAKFPFSRTMQAVLTSAGSTQSPKALFQQWMSTFGNGAGGCSSSSIDPNGYGLRCPRTPEAALASVDPFSAAATTTFTPVALFNRFDLAPTSGAHCGEYRIVYAMGGSGTPGRMFLIFEAALPNPNPAAGIDGCLPIARFWQNLTKDGVTASRATKLENFYFNGTAIKGVQPVVTAAHYGLKDGTAARLPGQIRTNAFVAFAEWHLREFQLRRTCVTGGACTLSVQHVMVKNNPADELVKGTHANSAAFQSAFLNSVKGLSATTSPAIKMSTGTNFDEFESVSQFGTDVRYSSFASPAFVSAIQGKLNGLGSSLTPANILDRATTQTCAGCHETSNGVNLGGGVVWPASGKFVHVDEFSNLSSALTTKFLPARLVTLEKFINARCTGTADAGAAPMADGLTVGGSEEGAAN
ncbi:MAG: hypothetical protein K1X89_25570 [Myxococcaceae bacterium]|nr:hypothetical protein [Myxococcaceae bacterium]